jgi:hypothetical protein
MGEITSAARTRSSAWRSATFSTAATGVIARGQGSGTAKAAGCGLGQLFHVFQVAQRIDVAECAGILEQHLGDLDGAIPAIHAAPAAFQVGVEFRQHGFSHQGKHGMYAAVGIAAFIGIHGDRHGQVRIVAQQRFGQARRQVIRQEGGIARRCQQPVRFAAAQAGLQAGQRAFKPGQVVLPDRRIRIGRDGNRRIGGVVAVGVDGQLRHLRRQPLQHMGGQRAATEWLQSFVDAAHAGAAAAGQYHAGHLVLESQTIPLVACW